MISIKICDPAKKIPFAQFQRNNTIYVEVPHEAASEVWISTDEPCILNIEAGGEIIASREIKSQGGGICISELKQPQTRKPGGFMPPFLRVGPKPAESLAEGLRLFTFRVYVNAGASSKRGELLASVEYHLLCSDDYRWACSCNLKLMTNPKAFAHRSIADEAEGVRCPRCSEVRRVLERKFLPK